MIRVNRPGNFRLPGTDFQMTDYSWIEDLLVRMDAQATLRESHGFLSGLVCSSTVTDLQVAGSHEARH